MLDRLAEDPAACIEADELSLSSTDEIILMLMSEDDKTEECDTFSNSKSCVSRTIASMFSEGDAHDAPRSSPPDGMRPFGDIPGQLLPKDSEVGPPINMQPSPASNTPLMGKSQSAPATPLLGIGSPGSVGSPSQSKRRRDEGRSSSLQPDGQRRGATAEHELTLHERAEAYAQLQRQSAAASSAEISFKRRSGTPPQFAHRTPTAYPPHLPTHASCQVQ